MSTHPFDSVFADLFGPAEQVYATMPRPSSLPPRSVNQSSEVAAARKDVRATDALHWRAGLGFTSAESARGQSGLGTVAGRQVAGTQAPPATSEATPLTKTTTAPPVATNNRGAVEPACVGSNPCRLDSSLEDGDVN